MLFSFIDTIKKVRKNMECGWEVRWSQKRGSEGEGACWRPPGSHVRLFLPL